MTMGAEEEEEEEEGVSQRLRPWLSTGKDMGVSVYSILGYYGTGLAGRVADRPVG